MKSATLFSGCEGAGQGLRQAGLDHAWSIELNPKAAAIAQANGFHTLVQDVTKTDWSQLERPDLLSVSPPCQRASVANAKQGESELDLALSDAVCKAIAHFTPQYFTLENVRGYQSFKSFSNIEALLLSLGYSLSIAVLDAADYGVPQNRNRLWMAASRDGRACLPLPTHEKPSEQQSMFSQSWVGWQDALSGLSERSVGVMSDRMIAKLPSGSFDWHLCTGFKDSNRPLTMRKPSEPAPTLLASMNRATLLPWLVTRDAGGVQRCRVIDVPHMAALQSFPSDYDWGDNPTAARTAIGNSVPPLQIQRIAEALIHQN